MPFEIAEKSEQENRISIGRIALEAIAAHILKVPPDNFNMAQWCGTSCCAIGHGVRLPEVQATGLRLVPVSATEAQGMTAQSHIPALNSVALNDIGTNAIAIAFGITEPEASMLFAGHGMGHDAETVAGRIRQFLAGELKPANHRLDSIMSVVGSIRYVSFSESIGIWSEESIRYTAPEAPRADPQPARKVRQSAKTGKSWPVAKHAYA